MKIAIATQNKGKFQEISDIFKDTDVELFVPDILDKILEPETGKTFIENAEKKALDVASATGTFALADDSGLEVDAIGGEPGVRSARYAGEGSTDKQNIDKLLDELGRVGGANRRARFVCAASLASPDGKVVTETGYCEGRITHKMLGQRGFGYDPVFIPNGHEKTMAQLSSDEKNKISHRGAAFRKLIRHLPR